MSYNCVLLSRFHLKALIKNILKPVFFCVVNEKLKYTAKLYAICAFDIYVKIVNTLNYAEVSFRKSTVKNNKKKIAFIQVGYWKGYLEPLFKIFEFYF